MCKENYHIELSVNINCGMINRISIDYCASDEQTSGQDSVGL